jgi:RimJ/RimL family protein N-acetyltransferase
MNYLSLIKKIAKDYLKFNSIFTYAYDLRPDLYVALERSGFKETKRLKKYAEINGKATDVRIHTVYFSDLQMRMAEEKDTELYYHWTNDKLVRINSYQDKHISHAEHVKWFTKKLKSPDCFFYLFSEKNVPCGQVRIDRSGDEIIIGISIDEKFRGKGLGSQMLNLASSDYLDKFPDREIVAYIKEENAASLKQFTKAGFSQMEKVLVGNAKSYKLKRSIT